MPVKGKRAKFTQTNLTYRARDLGYGYKNLKAVDPETETVIQITGVNDIYVCLIDRENDVVTITSVEDEGLCLDFDNMDRLFDYITSVLEPKYEIIN